MTSSSFPLLPFAPIYTLTPKICPPLISIPRRCPALNRPRFRCRSTTGATSLERTEDRKAKTKGNRGGKSSIRVRLDHQVAFGESVGLLGSSEELGAWKKEVPMDWTEHGWVCEVPIRGGGEAVEYKFVIFDEKKKKVVWESGGNRVLKVPDGGGVYDMVCHWNRTDEAVELLGRVAEDGEKLDGDGDKVIAEDEGRVVSEGELSPFVEQWQGKDISFMRSNEHRDRESERRWDTTGLEGVALKLVEGDRTARNWWRKVHCLIFGYFFLKYECLVENLISRSDRSSNLEGRQCVN